MRHRATAHEAHPGDAPISLAIIAGQLGIGGAEQQLYYMLAGLDRARFAPLVVTLGSSAAEHWAGPIQALGVPVAHVPRSLGRSGRIASLARLLRASNVAIVHAWSFHANPYAALAGRLARVPVRLGSMRESYAGLPPNRLWRWLGLRGLDRVVTNSDRNAGSLRGIVPSQALVRVVTNGVPLPAEATEEQRNRLKGELGWSPAHTVVGTIGRLDDNKNHRMLLRAFASAAGRWPLLRLVIIGGGPLMPQLRGEIEQLGIGDRARLLGPVPGAARFLPAFEICCLTSHTEGMPNLLMEASAAGVATVATSCGGTVELIADGVTGVLVGRDDDAALAAQLDALLRHPEKCRQLGRAGRAKMRREYSVDVMVASLAELYRSELAAKTGTGCIVAPQSSRWT